MNKNTIFGEILAEYQDTRLEHYTDRKNRISKIYEEIPEIKDLETKIRNLAINRGREILRDKSESIDVSSELEDLELAKIAHLVKNGYDENYLELSHTCPVCKDTGYVEGELCNCFRQRLATRYYRMSNLENLLKKENFATFDIDLFSDQVPEGESISYRENILNIRDAAYEFINNFEDESVANLLFYGTTGLGKTFMINCIAKELMDMGYVVVYQTAHNLFDTISEYRFNRAEDMAAARDKYQMLLEADLLIIDDLGTEGSNSFTRSEIFNILNTRNLEQKKMVISTNLTPVDLAKEYSDRVFSRLVDRFKMYRFFGSDLRFRR